MLGSLPLFRPDAGPGGPVGRSQTEPARQTGARGPTAHSRSRGWEAGPREGRELQTSWGSKVDRPWNLLQRHLGSSRTLVRPQRFLSLHITCYMRGRGGRHSGPHALPEFHIAELYEMIGLSFRARPADEVRSTQGSQGPLSGDESIVIGKRFNWECTSLYTYKYL